MLIYTKLIGLFQVKKQEKELSNIHQRGEKMRRELDIRAISLPSLHQQALSLLIIRALGLRDGPEVDHLVNGLFGDVLTYGQVHSVKEDDLAHLLDRSATLSSSVTQIRGLVALLPQVSPYTPVCNDCRQFSVSNIGGREYDLPVGSVCPFCLQGALELVPIKLLKLAWTSGKLVEPGVIYDHRSDASRRFPLTDAEILNHLSDDPKQALIKLLEKAGLPIYALLAYMNLKRNAFTKLENALDFLVRPQDFGLSDLSSVDQAIAEATEFVQHREVTNLPNRKIGGLDTTGWPRMTIGGRRYAIEGLVARGDKCDVFRARWDNPTTELVIIKVLAVPTDQDLLDREIRALARLTRFDDVDSEFYVNFVPRLIAVGPTVLPDGRNTSAMVYRYSNQFDWTLEDVRQEYPNGVHPRSVAWMMNRVSEMLGWLHSKRIVHGAITPAHVLIKALTHRVKILDWSNADSFDSVLFSYSTQYQGFYPESALQDKVLRPAQDVEMTCRCMLYLLGSDPTTGHGAMVEDEQGTNVRPIIQFLFDHAGYENSRPDAGIGWDLHQAFKQVAQSVYGPPSYHPFHMPAQKKLSR